MTAAMSNAEIADRLAALGQLLAANKENPYKVRAYQRAAAKIRSLGESVEELVRDEADLTQYAGIGDAIASAIREIVQSGTLRKLEDLRAQAPPEIVDISAYPRLDPKRVTRIYKKLGIASTEELRERLESGEIARVFGARLADHVRQGLVESRAMLLYKTDDLAESVERYLRERCPVKAVQAVGDYRRRVEVIEELAFVVETDDFAAVVAKLERYGGRTPVLSVRKRCALFALSSGIRLRVDAASKDESGTELIRRTGSTRHLRRLVAATGSLRHAAAFATEEDFYRNVGLQFIPPELREGNDEVRLAAECRLPALISVEQIRGDLHAHTIASDGSHSIEQMAEAARDRGYEYLGISDHSQSLKIARGVSVEDLWTQIRAIDRLNELGMGIRILKSAEVDILADGSLDYPDDLLRELDYTVCSIHSRFAMGKAEQTDRLLRAMDNRYFSILGHATGRLLLKRPGYEIDFDRLVRHAAQRGCFFEINSSPDRLDLSAENARAAAAAGVKIAINTDAHSTREFWLVRYGVDQARRAGLSAEQVLNAWPLARLLDAFRR
jgi:DNA polymerase (family 10)